MKAKVSEVVIRSRVVSCVYFKRLQMIISSDFKRSTDPSEPAAPAGLIQMKIAYSSHISPHISHKNLQEWHTYLFYEVDEREEDPADRCMPH